MVEAPTTRYAAVGDADVAYQVIGQGPVDTLLINPLGTHLELAWQVPGFDVFADRLASFGRCVIFDRRGTGMSDGIPRNAIPTWEDLAEDAAAVLDAAGSAHAAILASAETGPMALLFAAMHPQRVTALILVSTYARYLVADDYPIGVAPEAVDAIVGMVRAGFGTSELVRIAMPERASDVEYIERATMMVRSSATPRNAAAQYDYLLRSLDVRSFLPLVQAPTLVVNAQESLLFPAVLGRYLAEHIKGAEFIELPGPDMGFFGTENPAIMGEIEEFLTGARQPPATDRVLATVLFTDIVGSTAKAASLGDRRWHSLLDAHDRAVRRQLERFRGREVDKAGDGFLATFDGPGRAIECACAIRDAVRALGLEVRAGLHTGEIEVRGDDVAGIAVHIGARVSALAGAGEVLVSGAMPPLMAGSAVRFSDRGEHELKGVPGPWRLYAVEG